MPAHCYILMKKHSVLLMRFVFRSDDDWQFDSKSGFTLGQAFNR